MSSSVDSVGQPGQRFELELPAEHGCGREQVTTAGGQPAHPLPDHRANTRGDAEAGVLFGQPPVGSQQAHQLGDEERIALGLAVNRLGHFRRRRCPGERDVLGHVAHAQPGERDPDGVRLAHHLRERRGEGRLDRGRHVPEGADHQQPAVADLARDVLQKEQ